HGGLGELRGLLRGEFGSLHRDPYPSTHSVGDPYAEAVTFDPTREYPLEGPDAFGALPDDLVDEAADPTKEQSPEPPPVAANAGEHSRA
ncbi:MAG TPA: hypothetical protein VGJ84_06355, partial [Polyangiaceae bacterium]